MTLEHRERVMAALIGARLTIQAAVNLQQVVATGDETERARLRRRVDRDLADARVALDMAGVR